jgi:hypothetical protein
MHVIEAYPTFDLAGLFDHDIGNDTPANLSVVFTPSDALVYQWHDLSVSPWVDHRPRPKDL